MELSADVRARVTVAGAEGGKSLGDLEVVQGRVAHGYISVSAVVLTPLGRIRGDGPYAYDTAVDDIDDGLDLRAAGRGDRLPLAVGFHFDEVTFSGGRVHFDGPAFLGGIVDSSGAADEAPTGLMRLSGSPPGFFCPRLGPTDTAIGMTVTPSRARLLLGGLF